VITITAGIVTSFGSDGWAGVANLTDVSTNNVSTWGLGSAVTTFQYLFKGATSLISVPSNVPPNVTNMSFMFTDASSFNQDISSWDVSHVLTMLLMFAGATSFNQDIHLWDVSLVQNMSNIFDGAAAFNNGSPTNDQGHPLTWNTRSLRIMSGMFANTASFNQDISIWDITTNALTMEGMFLNASLFNQDISGWNVSSVINMRRMLEGAIIFNQNIRIWQVGASTDLTNMFNGATAFQLEYYGTTSGYDADPNTPLYTFFSYTPPPPPPPPQPAPVPRLAVGGGGGSFWFGREGFLFKAKGGGGARRSTKMAPGGNTTCNGPTYIYNKFKPGGGGVGASSVSNRRAKNRLATICNTQKCFPCFTTLGQYSNYTHNPNGYVPCPPRSINM
jgi:surface protein